MSNFDESPFHEIWPLLPRPDSATVLRWFARKGKEMVGDYAVTPDELASAARQYQHLNFYIMPNPTNDRCGTRVSAKEITHWSWFLLDIDPVAETYDAPAALEEALTWMSDWWGKDLTRRRPLIIDSGRGMQAWVRLSDLRCDDAAAIDESVEQSGRVRRKVATYAMSYWLRQLGDKLGECHGCRVDTSCSDLPRVMRCPGTYNQKTGRMASLSNGSTETYAGIAGLMVLGTPKQLLDRAEATLPPGVPWQIVFPLLNVSAKRYISEGQPEPGRHKAAFAAARAMFDVGLEEPQVLVALQRGNSKSPEPLPTSEVERVVKSALRA